MTNQLMAMLIHLFTTLKTLIYLYIKPREQRIFFQFENIIYVLIISLLHLNTYVMYLGHYNYFTLSVWGSTLDVRFWRLKSVFAL